MKMPLGVEDMVRRFRGLEGVIVERSLHRRRSILEDLTRGSSLYLWMVS